MPIVLISLGYVPGSGVAGQRVGVCLTLLETSKQFSKVAVPLGSHQQFLRVPEFLLLCVSVGAVLTVSLALPLLDPDIQVFLSLSPGAQDRAKGNADLVSLHVIWGQLCWLWVLLLSTSQILPAAVSGAQGTQPSWREGPSPRPPTAPWPWYSSSCSGLSSPAFSSSVKFRSNEGWASESAAAATPDQVALCLSHSIYRVTPVCQPWASC